MCFFKTIYVLPPTTPIHTDHPAHTASQANCEDSSNYLIVMLWCRLNRHYRNRAVAVLCHQTA